MEFHEPNVLFQLVRQQSLTTVLFKNIPPEPVFLFPGSIYREIDKK